MSRASPPSSNTTSTKRLITELTQLRSNLKGKAPSSAADPDSSPVLSLGPLSESDLYHWRAELSGAGLGGGYDRGRWTLDLDVPPGYPNAPPRVKFVTRIVASNVDLETGEICLDLLKDKWTPAYTLQQTMEAIWQMLKYPGTDSPLNVDLAALLRDGDSIGAEGLVRWGVEEWCLS